MIGNTPPLEERHRRLQGERLAFCRRILLDAATVNAQEVALHILARVDFLASAAHNTERG